VLCAEESHEEGGDERACLGVLRVARARVERRLATHVTPRGGVPVRVVVALLGTLEAAPVAVGILPRVDGEFAVAAEVLVGDVEAFVARAHRAVLVKRERLVHTVLGVLIALLRGRDAVGGRAIPQIGSGVLAHVLQHQVALDIFLSIAAAVLVGPLESKPGAFVEVHLALAGALLGLVVIVVSVGAGGLAVVTHLIPACSVVLGVEQPILVPGVVGDLIQLVVGASRVVHVEVRRGPVQQEQEHDEDHAHHDRSARLPGENNRFSTPAAGWLCVARRPHSV
jgi:hypothetical protein